MEFFKLIAQPLVIIRRKRKGDFPHFQLWYCTNSLCVSKKIQWDLLSQYNSGYVSFFQQSSYACFDCWVVFFSLRLSSPSNVAAFFNIWGRGREKEIFIVSSQHSSLSTKHTPKMGNEINFSKLFNERLFYLHGKEICTEQAVSTCSVHHHPQNI